MNLFFVGSVSLVCFAAELDDRCTTAAYVYAHEQLRLCFYVLVRYFVVFDIHV